jgi:flagellar basal-body rod protein FlgF
MNYGLYAAYLGMRARQKTLDVMANNIANASTDGYKAERLLYSTAEFAEQQARGNNAAPGATSDLRAMAQKQARSVGVITGSTIDFSPGPIRETGRPLDVALDGEGFLAVQTPRGERYTRAGSLTIDSNGQLVTHDGHLVIGEKGPITVPPGGEISIGEDGTLSVKDQTFDRLKLVNFKNPQQALLKEGQTLFLTTGQETPAASPNLRVVSGALETSNLNNVSEMAAMIQNSREFDSLQRNVTLLMNDLGRKVASEIGKI